MNDNELLYAFERCGHFLYHRRGGKRGQKKILALLSERGECFQSEIIKELDIRAASLSETVYKLEEKGFITRERDISDKRKILIKITDEGRRYFENNQKLIREQDKRLFDCLSVGEQQELLVILNKLLDNWQSCFDSELFRHKKRR